VPTYQYRCKDCELVFEASQRITDAPLTKCAECGGRVARVIQPVGIIFKGSGFHVNDYPNSKGRKRSDIPPPAREDTDSKSASSDTPSTTTTTTADKKTKKASGKNGTAS
jgi:putative FmdB family regulatory protein